MQSNIIHPFELSRMSINRRHNNLLKTSTVARADRTVTLLELTTLDAVHQYTSAAMSWVALSNVSRLPMAFASSDNNGPNWYPFLNHSTVGVGRPRTTHSRKKLSRSLTDVLEGEMVMVGERAGWVKVERVCQSTVCKLGLQYDRRMCTSIGYKVKTWGKFVLHFMPSLRKSYSAVSDELPTCLPNKKMKFSIPYSMLVVLLMLLSDNSSSTVSSVSGTIHCIFVITVRLGSLPQCLHLPSSV